MHHLATISHKLKQPISPILNVNSQMSIHHRLQLQSLVVFYTKSVSEQCGKINMFPASA